MQLHRYEIVTTCGYGESAAQRVAATDGMNLTNEGSCSGVGFFLMEYAAGGSLSSYLMREARLQNKTRAVLELS